MSDRTCSVPGCPGKINAKGLCDGHYRRWRKTGDAQPGVPLIKRIPSGAICTAEGCARPVHSLGLCARHYNLWHLYGSTEDRPRGRGPKSSKGIYLPGSKSPRHWVTCNGCGEQALVLVNGAGYCSRKCSDAAFSGEGHPRWVGANGGIQSKHDRVIAVRGKADRCFRCGRDDPAIRYHWANLTGDYDDIWDFAPMCPACHGNYDAPLQPRGSAHHNAKLTEEIVAEARRRHANGESRAALAREYGVSGTTMGYAISGRYWKHVGSEVAA